MSAAEVILVILVVAMCLLSVALYVARDRYERGYEDGLHSRLAQLAKQRYHRGTDCVLFVVPKDEYDKEVDDIS